MLPATAITLLFLSSACVGETPGTSVPPTRQVPPAGGLAGETWTRPSDGAVMVFVPAGDFPYGPGSTEEVPEQRASVDAFWIDRTEVTNRQYAMCVAEGGCDEPGYRTAFEDPTRADHPVMWIGLREAEAYCRWAGARLPREIEWEKAARGCDGRVYPWGDTFEADLVNYYWNGIGHTMPVGSYPGGASPYGALDMAGNVCEWVQDLWRTSEDYLTDPMPPSDSRPKGRHPVGHHYTLRGGSWADLETSLPTYFRTNDEPVWRTKDIGFRCAMCGEYP